MRPLVTSDWPLSRELFPYAVHVRNDRRPIVAGLRSALARHAELAAAAPAALELQRERAERQLTRLREVVGLAPEVRSTTAPAPPSPSPAGSAR
jgi:hypothetical protein